MLDKEIRTAILALYREGHSKREIAKSLGVSRNTIKVVIKSGESSARSLERASQLDSCLEEIKSLYAKCNGNIVRVQEKLKDGGCETSYSTLTWFCREHGIGVEEKIPTRRIVTAPGEEMQHDTSPYNIEIGSKKVKRHCASLVLGYSRMLFIRFYSKFDRFHCKLFLTEAFQYFGGTCQHCVIDNTHIVIACGTGRLAQISPEMEAFEKRFNFKFIAHELGHANRSGKVERPFWYIEKNFLAGRRFKDDDDLNRQALEWMEKIANPRQMRELKATPLELFASEKTVLTPLPLYVPEVYRIWQRTVNSYGCIALHEMKYPAPSSYIGKELIVRETKDKVILLDGSKEIAVHAKKIEGTPAIAQEVRIHKLHRQKQAQLSEEVKLKALGKEMQSYLEALKSERGSRYVWSVKKLYHLLCQYKAEDLLLAVSRARAHQLFDVRRIETILLQEIAQRDYFLPLSFDPEDYEHLPEYQQGATTPQPDIESYSREENPDDRKNP